MRDVTRTAFHSPPRVAKATGLESEDTICYCFHISKRKIQNYLRLHRLRRASQLSECGGAGTGCGWCVPYLKRYFEDSLAGTVTTEGVSAADYARQRGEYIRAGKGKPAPGATPLPPAESDAPLFDASQSNRSDPP